MKLMDELMEPGNETFVSFVRAWRGESGYAAAELEGVRLPKPLRRYLEVAGRLATGNVHLIEPQELQNHQLEHGRIGFMIEEQGVFAFATEPDGDDPPVWIAPDGAWGPRWVLEGEPLSRFLLQHAIFEAIMMRPESLGGWGWFSRSELPRIVGTVPRLPLEPWHHPSGRLSFHAAEDLIAVVFDDGNDRLEIHAIARELRALPEALLRDVEWESEFWNVP